MNFLRKMFKLGKVTSEDLNGKTFGELITKATDGELLVEGKPTYEIAHEKKHDLDVMLACCESEIKKYRLTNQTPAPFYFERAAILSRKNKNYAQEVAICEKYIQLMDEIFGKETLGVKAGPRFMAIEKRLPKAKELLAKNT
ncbi:conserved hypothetical protein [Aliivibrio fischeri MJ11]|uniref:Uncharacterized protein n=1 Tax=Aliivibrio fischeri (strain MJ11) TaxID=388396 RepID=B5EU93_ALIFM|nr:hypothetical protein [Aliivibrio fischeri]ACH63630.1 conserved hypothetical protein [Aliivibrio fischeri MJ11]